MVAKKRIRAKRAWSAHARTIENMNAEIYDANQFDRQESDEVAPMQ